MAHSKTKNGRPSSYHQNNSNSFWPKTNDTNSLLPLSPTLVFEVPSHFTSVPQKVNPEPPTSNSSTPQNSPPKVRLPAFWNTVNDDSSEYIFTPLPPIPGILPDNSAYYSRFSQTEVNLHRDKNIASNSKKSSHTNYKSSKKRKKHLTVSTQDRSKRVKKPERSATPSKKKMTSSTKIKHDGKMQSSKRITTTSRSKSRKRRSSVTKDIDKCSAQFCRLLAPFRPILGGHSISEIGGSIWFPTFLLLLWRLLCTCGTIFALVLFSATGDLKYELYSTWNYVGTTLAWILATFSSLRYLLCPQRSSLIRGRQYFAFIASLATFFYQIFLTSGVALIILYWNLLRNEAKAVTVSEIVIHALSSGLLLVDFFLSFRMEFRFWNVVGSILLVGIWIAFSWIWSAVTDEKLYVHLSQDQNGTQRSVLIDLSLLCSHLIFGVTLLLLNRINRAPPLARIIQNIEDQDSELATFTEDEFLEYDREEDDFKEIKPKARYEHVTSIAAPIPVYNPEREQTFPV